MKRKPKTTPSPPPLEQATELVSPEDAVPATTAIEISAASGSARPRRIRAKMARAMQAVGSTTAQAAHAAADVAHSAGDKAHIAGEKIAASKAVTGTKQITQTVTEKATGAGLAVGGAAAEAGRGIATKAAQAGAVTGSVTVAVGRGVKTKATTAGAAIGHGAQEVGQATLEVAAGAGRLAAGASHAAIERTVDASTAVGRVAHGTGHAVAEKASQARIVAAQSGQSIVAGATWGTGQVASWLMQNPTLQGFVKTLKVDGILDLVARVDLDEAHATVQELKRQHPHDTPEQLARRLTSGASGAALALTTADWSVIALLQAELVAQIACAYDLDVHDPARKGEFIAIFGLALGREWVIQIGRELLRPVPVPGTLVTALSNAGMVSFMGRAARRFYASQLHLRPSTADLKTAAADNATYLKAALAPQASHIADFLEFRTDATH